MDGTCEWMGKTDNLGLCGINRVWKVLITALRFATVTMTMFIFPFRVSLFFYRCFSCFTFFYLWLRFKYISYFYIILSLNIILFKCNHFISSLFFCPASLLELLSNIENLIETNMSTINNFLYKRNIVNIRLWFW